MQKIIRLVKLRVKQSLVKNILLSAILSISVGNTMLNLNFNDYNLGWSNVNDSQNTSINDHKELLNNSTLLFTNNNDKNDNLHSNNCLLDFINNKNNYFSETLNNDPNTDPQFFNVPQDNNIINNNNSSTIINNEENDNQHLDNISMDFINNKNNYFSDILNKDLNNNPLFFNVPKDNNIINNNNSSTIINNENNNEGQDNNQLPHQKCKRTQNEGQVTKKLSDKNRESTKSEEQVTKKLLNKKCKRTKMTLNIFKSGNSKETVIQTINEFLKQYKTTISKKTLKSYVELAYNKFLQPRFRNTFYRGKLQNLQRLAITHFPQKEYELILNNMNLIIYKSTIFYEYDLRKYRTAQTLLYQSSAVSRESRKLQQKPRNDYKCAQIILLKIWCIKHKIPYNTELSDIYRKQLSQTKHNPLTKKQRKSALSSDQLQAFQTFQEPYLRLFKNQYDTNLFERSEQEVVISDVLYKQLTAHEKDGTIDKNILQEFINKIRKRQTRHRSKTETKKDNNVVSNNIQNKSNKHYNNKHSKSQKPTIQPTNNNKKQTINLRTIKLSKINSK